MDNKVTKERALNHLEYDWIKYIIGVVAAVLVFYFVFFMINNDRNDETYSFFAACYSYNTLSEQDQENYNLETQVFKKMKAEDYSGKFADVYGNPITRSVGLNTYGIGTSEYPQLLATHGLTADALMLPEENILSQKATEATDDQPAKPNKYGGAVNYLELNQEALELLGISDDENKGLPFKTDDFEYLMIDTNPDSATYLERVYSGGAVYGVRLDNNKGSNKGLKNISKITNLRTQNSDGETVSEQEFYLFINRNSETIGKFGKGAKENSQAFFITRTFLETFR